MGPCPLGTNNVTKHAIFKKDLPDVQERPLKVCRVPKTMLSFEGYQALRNAVVVIVVYTVVELGVSL